MCRLPIFSNNMLLSKLRATFCRGACIMITLLAAGFIIGAQHTLCAILCLQMADDCQHPDLPQVCVNSAPISRVQSCDRLIACRPVW